MIVHQSQRPVAVATRSVSRGRSRDRVGIRRPRPGPERVPPPMVG